MVVEREFVHDFLVAMDPVREALGDFTRALYGRPEVKLASTYHPLAYTSSDFGISAELKNGAVVDFWIELERKGALWEMTFYIARHDPDEDGSHTEVDFPVEKITSAVKLPPAILAAINELRRRSADDMLFRGE